MRIIAGTSRGRLLRTPGKKAVLSEIRPTADRVREALFSILAGRTKGARVLDLFAGTGALGLEALSRGAEMAVFVDRGDLAIGLIRKNVELCRAADRSIVVRRDLLPGRQFLADLIPPGGFTLIFLDPPYRANLVNLVLNDLDRLGLLAPEGLVVAEENAGVELPQSFPGLILADQRQYGDTGIWFYRRPNPEEGVCLITSPS
ncbi:MAG: 16S rRNA (guanine(966)-N(2))-methyltransferase RsmD [Desulfobulbaceae bacterium]|nr:16S rRNA (guanine(966)-N(2))-methyltransferase RsmD [Desulfobulbaceae bacterium]